MARNFRYTARMPYPELRPRLPMLGVGLATVAGIAVADRLPMGPAAPLVFTVGLGALLLFFPRTWAVWLLAGAAFFTLHTLRHHGGPGRQLAATFGGHSAMVRATGVVWNVPQAPRVPTRHHTCSFLLRLETVEKDGLVRPTEARVFVRWAGPIPAYGDRVSLLGSLRALEPTRNPGEFDRANYEHRQGIWQELVSKYPADDLILSHGHGAWLQELAFTCQGWICHTLEIDLQNEPEVSALIESMVLGARTDTPDEIRDLFQRTGTMHLFAVSGLNVMMLAALAWFLLKPLRVSRRAAILLIIPLMALYAIVTGLSASCVRACLTASFLLAGYVLDRRPPAINSVAASAVFILAWDTNQLYSTGFQFTYIIVLALLLCATPVQRWFAAWAQPDPFLPTSLWSRRLRWQTRGWGALSSSFSVTLTGWSSSLVFTIGYFHLFSPAALVANLAAVPLAFGMLDLGVFSLLSGLFSSSLAAVFNNANWLLAKALLGVLGWSAALPGAYCYLQPAVAPPPCEFTVLDLGTGGAVHLRCGGQDWLLDCGHPFEYEKTVLPYLHARGVNSLDGLLLTHGDSHHLGAGISALEDFHPALVLDSPFKDRSSARKTIQAALVQRDQPKRIVCRGDEIPLGPQARLTVLFPPPDLLRSAADDKALVVRVEAAGRRALFMSDSGFPTEEWLLQHEPDLQADVLVKGQHPKDLSGTPDFLRRVHPAVVISAMPEIGASPAEHAEWKRSVEKLGIRLLPQESCGAVHVELRPEGVRAEGFLPAYALRKRAR